MRTARALLTVACVVGVCSGASAQDAQDLVGAPTMALSEVRVGMIGTGYTVVRGVDPERFQAEILGVLPDVFPKQSLIVARLSGLGLERSGVVAGMSGSPVVVDGRIIGAVAYQLVSFGHEAIAGIVPIENMRALAAVEASREESARPSVAQGLSRQVGELLAAVAGQLTGNPTKAPFRAMTGAPGVTAIGTPLSLSGWEPGLMRSMAPMFESLGWVAAAGGGSAAAGSVRPNLIPGGAVAVQLVRGDINVTASGTISYRDGDEILAFGHPFLQGGAVDFPLVAAEVVTVLSASQSSSKLTVAGAEILGSVRQDRLAAVLAVLGASPRRVPVEATIRGKMVDSVLRFEVAADPTLTPLYVFLGLVNGVQSLDAVYGDGAIEVAGSMRLAGIEEEIVFGNLFSGQSQAIVSLASTLAGIFGALYDNALEPADIESLDLELGLRSDRHSAELQRAWTDRNRVRAGESIELMIAVKPYRQPQRIERLRLQIPTDLAPGPLTLLVGDAMAATDQLASARLGAGDARDLVALARRLAAAPRSDQVHVMGLRPSGGAVVQGRPLPSLPSSVLEVLGADSGQGGVQPLAEEIVLQEALPLGSVVSGTHRLKLEILRR